MKKLNTIAALTTVLGLGAGHAALVTTYLGGDASKGSTFSSGNVHVLADSTETGDFWTGGDEGTYLHEENRVTGSFSAVVRVIGQSEAANGRWGKNGIMARDVLTATESSTAMAQLAAGNGSQPGGANPVPVRLAGRVNGAGFESDIAGSSNDTFKINGSVAVTWLRLDYDATTNGFRAGVAPSIDGAPGTWAFSDVKTDIPDTDPSDGWYVGMAYSAHGDMSLGDPPTEGMHSVTFDNFSITQTVIPEPSSALLGLCALGFATLRRKR